jgi:hypothetical protein
MLFILSLRAAKGPLRRVLRSLGLQLHLGLSLAHLLRIPSFVHHRRSLLPKLGSTRLIQSLCQREILVRVAPVFLPATCLAGTATSQAIGPGTVLILRRMSTKVAVRGMLIITVLRKSHLVRLSLLVSS